MAHAPSVTVVIPAYKASATISRPVESLLCQTHPPDEILIVDDGSPDDLEAALRAYGDRVTLIRKSNGGAASARNYGVEMARCEWIAFLDADDYWEPVKLQRQLNVLRCHPDVRVVCARWFQQVGSEPRTPADLASAGRGADYDSPVRATGSEVFRVAMLIWTSTVLIRRDDLQTYRFECGLEPAEDRDLWVRLVRDCPVYLLSEPLATYVQGPGSLSRSNIDRDCGNMLRVIRRYADLLGPCGRRRWEVDLFRRWAGAHLSFGRPAAAVRPACKRLRYQPASLEAWWVIFKALARVAAQGPKSSSPQSAT